MSNLDILAKNKKIYIVQDQTVFKFQGEKCFVKFKGKKEYEIETSTNLAMDALLGGEMITKEKYTIF